MHRYAWILPFLFAIIKGNSQDFIPMIKQAWEGNEQLQSKYFDLQAAENEMKEAKAMYGPTASLNLQYTLARGGRTIDFPIGDLMNPAYQALNFLTNSTAFPTIQNETINFLPNNFYDAKISIQQPIYYPDLSLNKQLKLIESDVKNIQLKAFKRQIAKEVMVGYINHQSALEVRKIYDASDTLLAEAVRSTSSMVKNGVALPSALNRIESQRASLEAQKIQGDADIYATKAYLQFILNKEVSANDRVDLNGLPSLNISSPKVREEVQQFERVIDMVSLSEQKENNFFKPKIGVQLDLGSQEFDFGFQPYALLGLNMTVNLFDTNRHAHRSDKVKAEMKSFEAQKNYVTQQFDLQQGISLNNLKAAIAQANTFQSRIASSKKLYDEIFRKYKEGSANYIELIDAQNNLTSTELQYNLARYNAWMKWAEHQYTTCAIYID